MNSGSLVNYTVLLHNFAQILTIFKIIFGSVFMDYTLIAFCGLHLTSCLPLIWFISVSGVR